MSSWWQSDLPAVAARPSLGTDLDVDVAIVGAGFTGLWTAYALAGLDRSLRIAVLERDVAGAGASGRNGGWCAAGFAASPAAVAARSSPAAARALHRALADTVDEVGRVAAAEGIDARYAKGGSLTLARSPAQLTRLRDQLLAARSAGLDDLVELTGPEARGRVAATGVVGGLFTPHCAVLDPARLVRGLAAAVCRRGVRLYEGTAVSRIDGRRLTAGGHRVRAEVVVTATEGYGLPGRRRELLPISSLMVVSEPLPAAVWDAVGWRAREAVKDARHLLIYAQRTADGRIALGGRGAPYRYGSRVPASYDRDRAVFAALWATVLELFPQVDRDSRPAGAWGGVLGAPRDWFPSVGYDRGTGRAWAGGYVGQGVAAANLAGRTLADLVLGRATDLTALPWVGHRSPRWEPEPLRWLGATAMTWAMGHADRAEARTGRPSSVAARAGRLVGR